jgi:ABC-2 type transport system permease protein
MPPMLTIARREFRSFFDSPLAYVIICLSLFLIGALFFFGFFGWNDFWGADRATMQLLFRYAPWGLCVLVVPVVTMRLLAEERRSGTLEMLITLPVKDSDVVLGKYLGAFGLVMVLVVATLAYPIAMFFFPWSLGVLDWWAVWAGYIGLVLLSAAAVSIGLLVSSLTSSQPVAAIITFVVLFLLYALGMAATKATGTVALVLRFIAFDERLDGFTKGLVDSRDVIYFLTITVICLIASFKALERRKWA